MGNRHNSEAESAESGQRSHSGNGLPQIDAPEATLKNDTVILLSADARAAARLRPFLTAMETGLRRCASIANLATEPIPSGPACLILDLGGGVPEPLSLLGRIRALGWNLPIIVWVEKVYIRQVVGMMRTGVQDVLIKNSDLAELVAAIRQTLEASRLHWAQLVKQGQLRERWAQLTVREGEVVRLAVSGMLNKQIADALGIALVTVKLYRASAMRKLGARCAADLARFAMAAN